MILAALASLSLLAIAIFFVLADCLWRILLGPTVFDSTGVDAVFVFAGGKGERFQMAETLVPAGSAVPIIANLGFQTWPGQSAIQKACKEAEGSNMKLVCVRTILENNNTAGEARLFSSYALKREYSSVLLVTSSYHMFRAKLRMSQCYNGKIFVAPVNATVSVRGIAHEIGGIIEAVFLDRSCRKAFSEF